MNPYGGPSIFGGMSTQPQGMFGSLGGAQLPPGMFGGSAPGLGQGMDPQTMQILQQLMAAGGPSRVPQGIPPMQPPAMGVGQPGMQQPGMGQQPGIMQLLQALGMGR